MKKYFLILTAFGFLNCSTDGESATEASSALLQGKWVEAESRQDTLTFEAVESLELMVLGRERELRDGFLLPKYGAGPYRYQLSPGKIALNAMYSSSTEFVNYPFTLYDAELRIGNFYQAGSGSLITFVRLE